MKRIIGFMMSMLLAFSTLFCVGYVYAADDTAVRYEAEAYCSSSGQIKEFSDSGKYVITAEINANINLDDAGYYTLTIGCGAAYSSLADAKIIINGTTYTFTATGLWSGSNAPASTSIKTVDLVVNMNSGSNSVIIEKQDNLITDYIELKKLPTVTEDASLRLEAEDYNTSGTDTDFSSGDGAYVITGEISADFYAPEAGTYVITVRAASRYDATTGTLTVNNDSESAKTFSAKGVWTDMTSSNGVNYQFAVALNEGLNNIKIAKVTNQMIDYIEISMGISYSSELYSYNLSDDKYLGLGNTWGLQSTYLGTYSGSDKTNTKTYASAIPLANDTNYNKYIYFPFTVNFDGEYILKVTYSSMSDTDAVVIVDPDTLPTSNTDCDVTADFGGTKKNNGKWQNVYSGKTNGFLSPIFVEKYINVGTLTSGDHNFLFVASEDATVNNGCAIRKVELLSDDMLKNELIISGVQFVAEDVQEDYSSSSSKLAETIASANEFSANSVNDSDKNTIASFSNVFNNSSNALNISIISASYNSDGMLLNIDVSDSISVASGSDANLKVKVNTENATYVKTYLWDGLSNIYPYTEASGFGDY